MVYDIKPVTQTDTRIRLRGKGVPSLRNRDVRGDHYVNLVVEVPSNLSAEAKEALRTFDQLSGNSLHSTEDVKTTEGKKKKKKLF